ncbi:acetyl-CoA synthetase-like protein [Xylaria sp. FL1042]|nr:acetyl-CoA synthetase-like protein [Xylaria sp. FL1042]
MDHSKISQWQGDLLPHIVDRLAAENPDGVYGLWPVAPSSYEAGFREVTYTQLANIVNGLGQWIIDNIGIGVGDDVLAYVGPNDVRYCALVLAAIKAGHVMFLTSPRNSPAAHRALFDKLNCQILLTTDPAPPPAAAIAQATNVRMLMVPRLDELLANTYPACVYKKTYEEAKNDPLIIIHTSGSTGLPKPLIWTHATGARHQNLTAAAPPRDVVSVDRIVKGRRVMVTLPPFHGAGVTQFLFNSIPFGNISISPAAVGIVTARGLLEALKQTPAEIALLVPSVVAELSQDPDLLEECAQYLELILYIGGDLPQAIGDKVASKIPLRCQWGASEVGIPQQLMPSALGPLDWRYIRFHPSLGAKFDEVSDGIYELVIQRDKALADTQAVFTVRGQDQLEEYRTKDLFVRHPKVSDAWCWTARNDDIIVFLNGEKTNPVSMEQHIVAQNTELGGALVVGAQRFQPALLIEPAASSYPVSTADEAALIERVWPSVEEANKLAPAHAHIEKSLILVATSDRPFIRSGKGTVQRASSVAQYTSDIEKLYASAEDDQDNDETNPVTYSHTTESIALLIQDSLAEITGWTSLSNSDSFFDRGMDSLQSLRLTRILRGTLGRPDLALSTIYQNPTIEQLAAAITGPTNVANQMDIMKQTLSNFQGLIKQIQKPKYSQQAEPGSIDVLLTGSTGTLGTLILHNLWRDPSVGHIFCANRGADSRSIQVRRLEAAGLTKDDLDTRVTFLQTELWRPMLGLKEEQYKTLQARVGLIIHNAWPVNFNLNLSAFRSQLAGVVNLCALSATATSRPAHFFFISSIGAVSGPALEGMAAPEAVLESLETPASNGYSQSKFISELLCDTVAKHLAIPVMIARVGQVAGSVRHSNIWSSAEWLPSLVISSLHLGCLPENLGPRFTEVDWIPSDLAAEAIVELAVKPPSFEGTIEGCRSAEVFNLRNPNTTTWNKLLPTVREVLDKGRDASRKIEVVAPSVWLERLQESMVTTTSSDNKDIASETMVNPAVRLVDFYRDGLWMTETAAFQPMSVEVAIKGSPVLRDMPCVQSEWMRKWVDEWMAAVHPRA